MLPSRYPNLLVNGTTGIAVGMATNIPPHNLREVVNAVVRLIDNDIEEKETTIDELIDVVKGPDFPTGGIILGTSGIKEAYRTGRGKIRVRAVTNIEPMENGKNRIVVTELPYNVNKARLIEKIAELHKDKKIDGITDLRDETSREGMRIVVELRRDVNPSVVLNLLFKHYTAPGYVWSDKPCTRKRRAKGIKSIRSAQLLSHPPEGCSDQTYKV